MRAKGGWRRVPVLLPITATLLVLGLPPTGPVAATVSTTSIPVADAWVNALKTSKNFGTSTSLRVRGGSSPFRSYLKFTVSGLSGTVVSAKLRLQVTDPSADGGAVYPVADTTWTESGITYSNAPALSSTALSSAGAVTNGQTIDLDLGGAITGNGTYSFALTSANSDAVWYSSKEGSTPPQLLVTSSSPPPAPAALRFEDVTGVTGLAVLQTAYSHSAAWGDANGDGRLDLFVGTFTSKARPDGLPPLPNRLLLGDGISFQSAGQPAVEVSGRASGSVFVDLDNDGDLDLVVSNNRKVRSGASPSDLEPHHLYRNNQGVFEDVSESSGIWVADRNGRAVGVLDYNNDGWLDLFIVADSLTGTGLRVSKLLKNNGDFTFLDETASAGLPTNLAGLGVAVGDANGDGWPDLLMTGGISGSGVYAGAFLFVNQKDGTFRDATTPNLAWSPRGSEDWTAGAAWGDLDRDGRLDLVVTHHFSSAASSPIAPRVYLNKGNDGVGNPILEELVGSGLEPIASKAPHVEIQDFDNDGWSDIYTSVVLDTPEGRSPYIYRNDGSSAGAAPTFSAPAGASIAYYSPGGPTADFDGDGRLDVFLEGLEVNIAPSMLRNISINANNWLQVKVSSGNNAMGLGAKIKVYRAGHLGDADALIGFYEISTGNGYSSAQAAIAHFGLGLESSVDVEVVLPFGGPSVTRQSVPANQLLTISI